MMVLLEFVLEIEVFPHEYSCWLKVTVLLDLFLGIEVSPSLFDVYILEVFLGNRSISMYENIFRRTSLDLTNFHRKCNRFCAALHPDLGDIFILIEKGHSLLDEMKHNFHFSR
mmetsp:Transcript_23914/g.51649  ORF Transcript_23914/g.51649 Transcript_23914/m.51649 type:complete len:113 (+) Transcript_23914:444-782(+)